MKTKKDGIVTNEEKNMMKGIWPRIERVMIEKYNMPKADCNGSQLQKLIQKQRAGKMVKGSDGKNRQVSVPSYDFFNKIKNSASYNDEYCNMQLDNLYMIADGLGVSADYLLGRSEKMDITGTGLSEKSVKTLKALNRKNEKYDYRYSNQESKWLEGEKYCNVFLPPNDGKRESNGIKPQYDNPYAKRIKMLNYIIEHIDMSHDGESFDFLILLYFKIFLRMEYKRENVDSELIEKMMMQLPWDVQVGNETMDEQSMKKILYDILDMYNEVPNKIVRFEDDLTGDYVLTSEKNPEGMIDTKIAEIIKDWRDEELQLHDVILEKMKKRQKRKDAEEIQEAADNNSYDNGLLSDSDSTASDLWDDVFSSDADFDK